MLTCRITWVVVVWRNLGRRLEPDMVAAAQSAFHTDWEHLALVTTDLNHRQALQTTLSDPRHGIEGTGASLVGGIREDQVQALPRSAVLPVPAGGYQSVMQLIVGCVQHLEQRQMRSTRTTRCSSAGRRSSAVPGDCPTATSRWPPAPSPPVDYHATRAYRLVTIRVFRPRGQPSGGNPKDAKTACYRYVAGRSREARWEGFEPPAARSAVARLHCNRADLGELSELRVVEGVQGRHDWVRPGFGVLPLHGEERFTLVA